MSFPPLNTIESPGDRQKAVKRQILMNIEPTSKCNLTPVCGESCILAYTHRATGNPLPCSTVELLIDETLAESANGNIRHIMLVAKEPTTVPEHVIRLCKGWHKMNEGNRALSIGMISASPSGIESLIPSLIEYPLSSVLISIDTDASGLRTNVNNNRLLTAALNARRKEAINKVGVNTTVQMDDLQNVLTIGRAMQNAQVDQWTVAGFCLPNQGLMSSVLSQSDYNKLIDFMIQHFASSGMRLTIDLPYKYFDRVGGWNDGMWRTEHQIAPDIFVQTLNPRAGFFARVRWDGEILGLEDALQIGTRNGAYGTYAPGAVAPLIERLITEQSLVA